MAKINNQETLREIRIATKPDLNADKLVDTIGAYAVPVIECNPAQNRFINVVRETTRTTTGTGAIYNTDAKRDFFLCGFSMSVQTDAACDNTSILFTFVPANDSSRNIRIAKLTTTATSQTLVVTFPKPILLGKASTISTGSTFSAGACTIATSIFGYECDPYV